MRLALIYFLILFIGNSMIAQDQIIPLWPDGNIPNYIKTGEQEVVEIDGIIRISKIQKPHIEVFLPSKSNATGQGVVIFPGGGYMILAYDWEGTDIAKWYNSKGIAAFVVKNRLPDDGSSKVGHLSPFLDARRAMRMVRHHAKDFNIEKDKIGVMGFSAGGHLASTISTHYNEKLESIGDAISMENARPDFSVLVYPVISMQNGITHGGSRNALLGETPSQELIDHYSNEKQITEDTPPTILIHSSDDEAVPVKNSLLYYEALIEKNVKAELHVYPHGGHGFSLATKDKILSTWIDRVFDFLKEQ